MPALRSSILAFLIFILVWSLSTASDVQLTAGNAQQGTVTTGETQYYVLSLTAGDFPQVSIDTHGAALAVTVYDPSGIKIRGFRVGPQNPRVDFVTDATGLHRVEIGLRENIPTANFSITLVKVLTLADRLGAAPVSYESPRIKALRAALDAGKHDAVDSFWAEVKKDGAPLIEPLAGDDENMLVTFVWKGLPDTRNVLLAWFPFTGQCPDDFRMRRLGATSVWYKTLKVGKRKRFAYNLAPNAPNLPADITLLAPALIDLLVAATQPDPLNPKRWAVDLDDPDVPGHRVFPSWKCPTHQHSLGWRSVKAFR